MILITGATGYIGSHLALYFDKKKINYIGVDNLSYSYRSNINNKNNLFVSDISNSKKIGTLIEKYNVKTIIHTATFSYVLEAEDKKKYQINNLYKTKRFINLCKRKKIKHFVFLSSSNVYKEKKITQVSQKNLKLNQKIFMDKIKQLSKNI